MRSFLVLTVLAFSASALGEGYSPRPIQFASDQWRPLSAGEVCPQGHVEAFDDDAAGRHWTRPQVRGQDVPCGMAKRIGAMWYALDSAEFCQQGFVGDVLAGMPGRSQVSGQDVPCSLVRMP